MRLKTLGLAAIAALAAMAFVVPAALAEEETIVVCGKAELDCKKNPLVTEIKEGKPVAQIHGTAEGEFEKEKLNPVLLSSIGTVECEKSLANITVFNELAKLLLGQVTELSFTGNCHLGGTTCTVTTVKLGEMSFTHNEKALEALAISTGGTEVTVKCGFFINCTYIANEKTELTATSESGEVKLAAKEALLEKSKGICPATSSWDATYIASGTMYIES
jgi:hypothetical protein